MRIGIFTNNYEPIVSGITESIKAFREGLENLGHEVFIFAPNYSGYKDTDPNVFRFPSLDIRYKTKYPIAITCCPMMFQKVKRLNLDIIHTQHPMNVGVAGLKFARKLGIPVVFTNHTQYDAYAHFVPLPKFIVRPYLRKMVSRYANKCDVVISPSQSIKELITGWGMTGRIEVLPTGIRPEKFANASANGIREKFSIADDEFLLLTVARLAVEKNVDFLIHAFAKIKENKPDRKIKFMIVGGGSDGQRLKKITNELGLSESIIFVGSVPHDDVPKYFKAGDIFVYASLSETQGIMVLESMASELPIVAVKAPGAQDFIDNGVNGLLPPNDEGEFVNELERLINDEELRNKISAKGLETAQKHSVAAMAEKMARIYESAIAEYSVNKRR